MKKLITWITLIAFFLMTLPTPVHATPQNVEQGPIDAEEVSGPGSYGLPTAMKVSPIEKDVAVTAAIGKVGVLGATIPFMNEFGQRLNFKADFGTNTWTIEDTNGVMAGGALTAGQAETIKLYALDWLKPANQRLKGGGEVLIIIGLIIAALALGFQYVTYLNDLEDSRNEAVNAGNACAADMARDSVSALRDGAFLCSYKPERTTETQICWSTPEYNSPNPELCLGMTFRGCKTVCN
jgi:hypothetical protein